MPLSQVSSLMTDRWCHKGNEIWRFFGWSLASLKNKYFKKYLKIYEINSEVYITKYEMYAGLHTNRNTLVFRCHGPLTRPPHSGFKWPHACCQNVLFVTKEKGRAVLTLHTGLLLKRGGGGCWKRLVYKRKRSSRIDFTHRTFAEKGGSVGTRICVP